MLGVHYANGTENIIHYTAQKAGEPLCCGLDEANLHVVRVAQQVHAHEQLMPGKDVKLGGASSERWAISLTVQITAAGKMEFSSGELLLSFVPLICNLTWQC